MADPSTELWRIYISEVKKLLVQSDSLGADDKIYIPPMNAMAILAGNSISAEKTNAGVAKTGDSLINFDSPTFTPSNDGYAQKCLDYLNVVDLPGDKTDGTKQLLDTARTEVTTTGADLRKVTKEAQKAYKDDPDHTNVSFKEWISLNYPEYSMAQATSEAANTKYAALQSKVSGPLFAALDQKRKKLNLALDVTAPNSYNYAIDESYVGSASSSNTGAPAVSYRPKYDIDAAYPKLVNDWISNASHNSQKTDIVVDFSKTTNQSWQQLGFEESKIDGSAGLGSFFRVSWNTEHDTKEEKHVKVENQSSEVKITITASGIAPVKISPSPSWNPGEVQKTYPKIAADAPTELWRPMVQVKQLLIAYDVYVKIELDGKTFEEISDHIKTAKEKDSGASISIFGFNINVGPSDHEVENNSVDFDKVTVNPTHKVLEFPAANNAIPILLGVVGARVGEAPKAA